MTKIEPYQVSLITVNLYFMRYHMGKNQIKAEYYALRILEIAEEIWTS